MLVAHADSPGLEEEADACHRVVTTSNLALLSRGKQRWACGAHGGKGHTCKTYSHSCGKPYVSASSPYFPSTVSTEAEREPTKVPAPASGL
eukprot:COSAG01_NODE_3382_length_6164_cov_204.291838_6_plen_91_part_00